MAATPVENKRPEIKIPEFIAPTNNDPSPLRFPYLPGVFRRNNRPAVKSTNTGGVFPNAKAASMLEKGLIKKGIHYIRKGNSGILAIYDGPEIEVSVERGGHYDNGKYVFSFKDTDEKVFDMPFSEKWELYTRTTPVPFVHKKSRRSLKRKTRRQKGGFYPSVYGGIAGAKMLTPLIARQMMRMYEQVGYKPLATSGKTNTRKTRKSKSKKTLKNKRA